MYDTDKATVSYSGKSKELSELVDGHFESVAVLAEKFKLDFKEHLALENSPADEEEKTILLDLSSEVAAARNKDDLFEVVQNKLETLFSIIGFAIVLISAEDHLYRIFEFSEESYQPDGKGLNDAEFQSCSFPRSLFDQLTDTKNAVVVNVIESLNGFPNAEYFKTLKNKHVEKFVGISLKVGGDTLGYLLLYMDPFLFDSLRINLLKGVCAQLSVALSNIILIEEITRRKNQMELLLSINSAIASVRTTEELALVIKPKFKQLLGCSHTLIALCNDDGATASAFLLDEDAKSKVHPAYQNAKNGYFPVNDLLLGKAMQTDLPVLFDLEELALQADLPLYAKVNLESGQKALIITRFAKSEEVFGFWLLYFEEKQNIHVDKLKLVQSLSHQLCIAVANIVAHQEIKSREAEKERLLKFSNAIASVRDKVVLSQILKVQLHELFGINNYIIHVLNKQRNTHTPMLYDTEAIFVNYPEFSDKVDNCADIDDGFLNVTLTADGPVYYEVNDESTWLLAGPYKPSEKTISGKALIGIAIQLGSEDIAVMRFIHPDYRQIKQQEFLLKSICSQIAIGVANIMANEKVKQQLIEIDRYKQQLEEETIYLKEEIEVNQNYAEIIGESPVMQKTFRLVTQVAPSDSTVLILGETGTGKELIARAIHNNSPRKNKLMVKVNCAALPANLIESELFGHEKGSFTGATERRLGKFELANNGTLFLDEIGEMPLELQVKLLRALQEKEIERVGGRGTIKVDVRIVAATNRDLEKEVDEGRFRSDLYYRLNIFPIQLSALRDRKEDIPVLAAHFIQRYSKKTGRQITTLGNKALQEMMHYSWPGNIRELEHLIERSILLSTGDALKQIHLPVSKPGNTVLTSNGEIHLKTIDENECEHILQVLKVCQGRISGPGGAADILGVPPSTLNSKIRRLGIKKEHFV